MPVATFAEVLDLVAGAVDGSAEAQAYCQATWGRPCKVFMDIDPEAPPAISEAPMVHLDPALRHRDGPDMEHVLLVGVFVESGEHALQEGTHIYKRPGRDRLEALGRLVEHAVGSALHGADIPAPMMATDPDATWGAAGQGLFYSYRIRFRDPL